MIATHEVLKPFEGASRKVYKQGEQVDARNWPHLKRLEDQRYLRPLFSDKSPAMPDDRLAVLEQGLEAQGRVIAQLTKRLDALEKKGGK